ncbi:DUF2235 domain-containing protein [Mycobacterium sp. SMC-8]|uniref:DUF2235 domain-containing protein n=1 Tax=Mycobacterium sp. SMC-8 TaxID=2857060 RepID=UPI0021FEE63D|nr:DUF2235 domain-containing protein [Mycobacterium sp. SMC-8]
MRRLVICCDGTWKRSDDPLVSNIEKIARAVRTQATDGTNQLVLSSNGVGTNGFADRIVGGAFGVGLDNAVIGAYRFLALNYRPGDQIFVFGFSRGAYTARSLVGMIARIGLLNPPGVVQNRLLNAMEIYRRRPRDGTTTTEIEEFRASTYRGSDEPGFRFLGVFDTVGALGAPGLTRKKYKFHDVDLTEKVEFARQALAIDERRLTFSPCLWKPNRITDIKQVWFEGVHSDIGGGYPATAPADLTLRWMVHEASERGLEFDYELFHPLQTAPLSPNNSMSPAYQLINIVKQCWRTVQPKNRSEVRFRGSRRLLAVEGDDDTTETLRIAEPAYERWHDDTESRHRRAPNIGWWSDSAHDLTGRVEVIPPLGYRASGPVANSQSRRAALEGRL